MAFGESPRSLLNLIETCGEFGGIRTTGVHAAILRRVNEFVTTEKGGPVRGIRVALTPQEQELYRREFLDLTPQLDFGKFTEALRELYHDIASDEDRRDDKGRN